MQVSSTLVALYFIATAYRCFVEADGYRRSGLQGAVLNETLWLVGGLDIWLNSSGASPVSNLSSVNLSASFDIPETFTLLSSPQPTKLLDISNGTIWSNEIDTAWLYGGQSSTMGNNNNSIWRFTTSSNQGSWTELHPRAADIPKYRPTHGAGCNVPSRDTGYYLGGYILADETAVGNFSIMRYLHSMTVFDMNSESIYTVDIPNYIPIVDPSLVYLDAGSDGALIVLGGQTESNGFLDIATLTNIYIYDIATALWFNQSTTDDQGRSDHFLWGYDIYGSGIPDKRYMMCAVVGAAPDESSYNIYIFGGFNGTEMAGDLWVLTLPSAIWIRLYTADITNNPKTGSSCNLINDRYVLMAGGCWGTGIGNCASYGWDPLLYDIVLGDWSWSYDPALEGYFVPDQVYNVIGGNDSGGASISSPKFTNFGDPVLVQLFHRPLNFGLESYYRLLKTLLSVISCLPLVVTAISILCTKIKTVRADWTGGDNSIGTWTGQPYHSTFVPAANSTPPNRGLVLFYLDVGFSGPWNRKNATQRMGIDAYILWTYVPSIVAVVYGILWMLVDGDIKRLEKYRQLSRPGGCRGDGSICLDYHCFWIPLSVFQALRHRQWVVVYSSTGYVLSLIAIPNLQSYVFYWANYSGGTLSWGGQYSWQVGLVDQYWSGVLVGVLSINMLCVVGIMLVLTFRNSEITRNPIGISNIAELVSNACLADFNLDSDDELASLTNILEKLRDRKFSISDQWRLVLYTAQTRPSRSKRSHTTKMRKIWTYIVQNFQHQVQRFGVSASVTTWFDTKARGFIRATQHLLQSVLEIFGRWTPDSPHSALFRPIPLVVWNMFLLLLLSANLYVLGVMTKPVQMSAENYALPWSPNVYLLVAVFVQSIFQVLERNVRCLTVFDALHHGYQTPRILWDDFTTGTPILEIFAAFRKGHHLLGYVMLASLATVVYTIILGSLQVSASFYGATSFMDDLGDVVIAFSMNLVILAVSVAATCRYGLRVSLPRYPGTIASMLPFVLSSEKLKEDLNLVEREDSPQAKAKKLKEQGRRYGFGRFVNDNVSETEHLGVERNYVDGPNGKEHVSQWKMRKYGWGW
ncbi:hypothetical protein MMC18_007401 [Xylographa bjoerkii]|nr:hypothetical protein [Xylographa bjoerkii]